MFTKKHWYSEPTFNVHSDERSGQQQSMLTEAGTVTILQNQLQVSTEHWLPCSLAIQWQHQLQVSTLTLAVCYYRVIAPEHQLQVWNICWGEAATLQFRHQSIHWPEEALRVVVAVNVDLGQCIVGSRLIDTLMYTGLQPGQKQFQSTQTRYHQTLQ